MASIADGPNGEHISEFAGFTLHPNPAGGQFGIYGQNFGPVPQPVTINGVEMKVTSWRVNRLGPDRTPVPDNIKGLIPMDFPTGPCVVEVCGAKWECELTT